MSSYPIVLEDKFLKIAPIITPLLAGGSVVKDVCGRVAPVVSGNAVDNAGCFKIVLGVFWL
jgi:hypothetical protein